MTVTELTIDVVHRSMGDFHDPSFSDHPLALTHGILRVFTADGIEGNCIIGEYWGRPEIYFDPIIKVLKPALIGRCASERERLWTLHNQLHKRFKLTDPVWAAVDIALWDIAGKAAGLPVYKLLGTQRDAVEAYATYPWACDKAEQFVAEAENALELGFTAYKIHPGRTETREVCRTAELVRQQVGNDVALMLDPNCGYDFRKALEIGRALDETGFRWFEDPVSYTDIDAITELSSRLTTPLCMTDQAPQQLFTSADFIRRRALRMVRGTALRLGITGLKKLCSLAEGFGLNCEAGTGGNALTNIANLHVLQSIDNCDYFEFMLPSEIEQFGLANYLELDDAGKVSLPDEPGLGFALDEDWIKSQRVETLG
ncbi:MAG: mandelate racemase [Rhodobacteraceae bacterium]|nr:mandelate racemase [Paracoccaceae bacterium]